MEQCLDQRVGAQVSELGVPSPESWTRAIHAVWYWVQNVGSLYPAELLGVQAVEPPARSYDNRALIEPGGWVAVNVMVQGPSDGAPRSAVGGVVGIWYLVWMRGILESWYSRGPRL